MNKYNFLIRILVVGLCFSITEITISAQCHNNDFKALKFLYEEANGGDWLDTTNWSVFANNNTCPLGIGFDLGTLHGISLNANDRVSIVNLKQNNLTGSLTNVISLLEELITLNIEDNTITGVIPASLGDIATLENLSLQRNRTDSTSGFTGPIPITGSNFLNLKNLRLNKNSLIGGIPDGVGSLSNIIELSLHNNHLQGTLPHSIGNLASLQTLKLQKNGLVGCIPLSYENLQAQSAFVNIDSDNSLDATWVDFTSSGAGACKPFVTTWVTDNPSGLCITCITLPIIGGPYDVDWENDGVYDDIGVTGTTMHDYLVADTFQIAIRGNFDAFQSNGYIDRRKIISIDQWGDNQWKSMAYAFDGCDFLSGQADDIPNLDSVKSMLRMFKTASKFNQDISGWDVSQVTDMAFMFWNANSFNQDIGGWEVDSVTNMSGMFENAADFNQDISEWDVGQVTSMSSMFQGASDFNQDIGEWEVGQVTSMSSMFYGASQFNQDISDWNVERVKSMSWMFWNAHSFNQDIGGWDVDSVTNMARMFWSANDFNQDLSDWEVSAVTDMSSMFKGADSFNQPLDWGDKTANVIDMSSMFTSANAFNQNISGWTPVAVTDMRDMFNGASSFNQDISSWSFPLAIDLNNMFFGATSFNQNLASWDISNVEYMDELLSGTAMSIYNYDQTLIAWSTQSVPMNIGFYPEGLIYCEGSDARDILMTTYNWDFDDLDQMDNGTNAWESSVTGNWNDLTSRWTLARLPTFCNDVAVDNSSAVTIKNNRFGNGATLDIGIGSSLDVEAGAILEIR